MVTSKSQSSLWTVVVQFSWFRLFVYHSLDFLEQLKCAILSEKIL